MAIAPAIASPLHGESNEESDAGVSILVFHEGVDLSSDPLPRYSFRDSST